MLEPVFLDIGKTRKYTLHLNGVALACPRDEGFVDYMVSSLLLDLKLRECRGAPFSFEDEKARFEKSSTYEYCKQELPVNFRTVVQKWSSRQMAPEIHIRLYPDILSPFTLSCVYDFLRNELCVPSHCIHITIMDVVDKHNYLSWEWLRTAHGQLLFSSYPIVFFKKPDQQISLAQKLGPAVYQPESPPVPVEPSTPHTTQKSSRGVVYQLLARVSPGDAVTIQAFHIASLLKQMGYEPKIAAASRDESLKGQAETLTRSIHKAKAVLYHYSIDSEATDLIQKYSGPKAIVYHNITPAHFFAPYRSSTADLLESSRRRLTSLSRQFALAAGDSFYNRDELLATGFGHASVLPLIVEPFRWQKHLDCETFRMLNDGKRNILFTGRISPNKRQDRLVRILEKMLETRQDIRLCLPGSSAEPNYYNLTVDSRSRDLIRRGHLYIPGAVNLSQLHTIYQASHLYLSVSEHEGFGVPLIEAMWYDLPVLALDHGAVRETLSINQSVLPTRSTDAQIAESALMALDNAKWRNQVLEQQRLRRNDFTKANLHALYENFIEALLKDGSNGNRNRS